MLHLREASVVDDDPLYDSVASDEDYAMVPEEEVSKTVIHIFDIYSIYFS